MAKIVRIGHASTDEAITSSAEVLISNYYASLKPTVVLRPNSSILAEKSAAACEAGCYNNKIEYSQAYRNTLKDKAAKVGYNLANITELCYADCSSFMTVCAIAGGANIAYISGAPNCGSMRRIFTNSGDYAALTDSIYLNSSDYLRRGDILVRENYLNGSRHTVMVLDNGDKISASAQINPSADATQWIKDFFAIKIAVNIDSINATSVSATAQISKIEDGKEKILNDSTKINTFDWLYELTSLTNSKTKAASKKLQISSGTVKFSLDTLIPNSSYILKVTAKEKDSEAEFDSPNILFTTSQKVTSDETPPTEFTVVDSSAKSCKVFIKIKDVFKRALIYNRFEE